MEKSKIAYLILRNLYNGNILSDQELGLNKKEYAEILNFMQNEELISGVRITKPGQEELMINNENEKITLTRINYLMENTIPNREYKIQVSVDEILNGIELSANVDSNGTISKFKKIFYKPLADINVEAESFLLAAEGLKVKNEKGSDLLNGKAIMEAF